jgi:hypothetical protein
MAQFGKMKKMSGIQEERGFTNPHVRFIRKRGRIIPIYNKKRIGQDITSVGEKAAVAGAIASAGTYYAKKSKDSKKVRSLFKPITSRVEKASKKFKFKTGLFDIKGTDGFRLRNIKRGAKLSGKAAKFGMRNSGKIGLGLLGIGILGKLVGDELQMRSAFGKDFFFTKDRGGRSS